MYFEVSVNCGPAFVMRSDSWESMRLWTFQFLSAKVRRLKVLE